MSGTWRFPIKNGSSTGTATVSFMFRYASPQSRRTDTLVYPPKDGRLAQALAPVLDDLKASGIPLPVCRAGDQHDESATQVILYSETGAGTGFYLSDESDSWQVARLADQVQDWVVEELWAKGESPVWPICLKDHGNHPLKPVSDGARSLWTCPRSGQVIAEIG